MSLLLACGSYAEPNAEATPDFSPWIVGAGIVRGANPYIGDAGGVTAAVPMVGYLGERLTWVGPNVGWKAWNCGDDCAVSLQATARFQGFDADESGSELAGMESRDSSIDGGVRVDLGAWRFDARHDLAGVHSGSEIALQRTFDKRVGRRWQFALTPGVAWQSEDLANYYYGVRPDEARSDRSAYATGSAINANLDGSVRLFLTSHWMLWGQARVTVLDSSLADSPIIEDRTEKSAMLGLIYRFHKK